MLMVRTPTPVQTSHRDCQSAQPCRIIGKAIQPKRNAVLDKIWQVKPKVLNLNMFLIVSESTTYSYQAHLPAPVSFQIPTQDSLGPAGRGTMVNP